MLQLEVLLAVLKFVLALLAQWKIGVLGALLLPLIFVGIRARHTPTAVSAAILFAILMSQA
ncbi:hypothetical protein ACFVYG_33320 [Streptomyces sp. NPDC058256]|uniref:hypothetical protein n=1 Tax=Streptomyces sp. NPDC058256 TaxID=3346408 RepID=UPI0036F09ED4